MSRTRCHLLTRCWPAAICGLLLALALAAQGCAAVRYVGGVAFEDDALASRLRDQVEAMYPAQLRAEHLARLQIGPGRRKLECLRGYVLARRPGDVRLLAMHDFGGTLFDVVLAAGAAQVVKQCPGMPRRWLTDAAARDAAVLYLACPSRLARLVRHDDGAVGLVDELPGGRLREFVFDPSEGRLVRYVEARTGRVVYQADFSRYARLGDWPREVPCLIEVTDFVLNYTLTVSVLSLSARELDDKVFLKGP